MAVHQPPVRHLLRAKDLIDARYRDPLDVPALARTAHLSPAHFSREFRRAFGETPHQYLLRKRAKTALRLLQTTPLDVCEIASSVGFAQRHALLRQMRRWTGLSPREIRRAESVPALES